MTFWENVGKSVSNAAATAAQKTKDVTEIGTLMARISQERHTQDAAYLELGRQYASLHSEDYEEIFSDVMQRIAASEQTIRASEQRIRVLKGERMCPKCGAPVSGDTRFCTACGTRLQSGAPRSVCSACGAVLEDGAAFCSACGEQVKASSDATNASHQASAGNATETIPDTPSQNCTLVPEADDGKIEALSEDAAINTPGEHAVKPQAADNALRCPRCGHSNDQEAMFCVFCGQNLV